MEYLGHFQSAYAYNELYKRKYESVVYEFLLYDNKSYTDDYYHIVYYFYSVRFDPYSNGYCYGTDCEEYQPDHDSDYSEYSDIAEDCTLSLDVYKYINRYAMSGHKDYTLQSMCVDGEMLHTIDLDTDLWKAGYYTTSIFNNFIIVEFYKA